MSGAQANSLPNAALVRRRAGRNEAMTTSTQQQGANLRGSMTALVTPFKDGQIDEAAFRALVDWQIENGTAALVPVGTTGESPTLSHPEHMSIVEIAVAEAGGRVP